MVRIEGIQFALLCNNGWLERLENAHNNRNQKT